MKDSPSASVIDFPKGLADCRSCRCRKWCLLSGLKANELSVVGGLGISTRTLEKGETLYRMGDRLDVLYIVRSGSLKTSILTADGDIQILAFILPGELLGADAISTERHPADAVALEDALLCQIPFKRLEDTARKYPDLQHQLIRLISQEIVRDEELLLVLSNLSAEVRLGACILNLSQRYGRQNPDADSFTLPMTRQDLGDYTGLALETVSRLLSRFHKQGILHVEGRKVTVLDKPRLQEMVAPHVSSRLWEE